MRFKPPPFIRKLLFALGLASASIGGYALFLVFTHNFHAVAPGIVYRSCQLSGPAFERAIRAQGLKTIVNLRGANPGSVWYRAETNATDSLGVAHLDFALSAGRAVSDQQMADIIKALRDAPKPILIHCQAGSDRTGLAAALYLYAVEGKSAAEAGRALSWRYGHFPHLFWRNTAAMDQSFWRYVSNHVAHSSPEPNNP